MGNDRTLMKLYGIDSEEIPAYALLFSIHHGCGRAIKVVKAEDGQMESIQSQVRGSIRQSKRSF